ncbi:MAG TPA: 16S rRNA (cytidine(1402)-2'-O)-methyltransferase [Patescibacteria group bacterium]|nr:16S rRNA (cytidine(1402)-2'-O)-methyltransferase [Patescibacteria group bacterium]
MGNLYIVSTPIGNLEDITFRAIKTLKEADLILCEDTRQTKKLLSHYEIPTRTESYHHHSSPEKVEKIIKLLEDGLNIALVSDAGTPGISDPGGKLVEAVLEKFGKEIKIIPIPGPSALATIVSVSGLPTDKFIFLGFPPHKKGKNKFFEQIKSFDFPAVYYESPYRLLKNLELVKEILPEKKIVLGRELTKIFEEVVRGSVDETLEYFKNNKDKVRGEIVIILY